MTCPQLEDMPLPSSLCFHVPLACDKHLSPEDHIQTVARSWGMTLPPIFLRPRFPRRWAGKHPGLIPSWRRHPVPCVGLSNLAQGDSGAEHRPVVRWHSFLFSPERRHGFAARATSAFNSTPHPQDAGSPTYQSCLGLGSRRGAGKQGSSALQGRRTAGSPGHSQRGGAYDID